MLTFSDSDLRKQALSDGYIVAVGLFDIGISGTMYRLTESGLDISEDVNEYQSGHIVNLTTPESKGSYQRDIYQLSLGDNDRTWFNRCIPNHTGITLKTRVGFLYNDTLTDTIDVFSGRSTNVQRRVDQQTGATTILSFTGPLSKYDSEFAVLLTPDNQKRRDPTDTSLRYIHSTPDFTWGQKR